MNNFNDNYPLIKEPLPKKRRTRNDKPVNFLQPEMARLIDHSDAEGSIIIPEVEPRRTLKRKASEIAHTRCSEVSNLILSESENHISKVNLRSVVHSIYNDLVFDIDERSTKRPRKPNKHDAKDLLVGHHIDDERLPGGPPSLKHWA